MRFKTLPFFIIVAIFFVFSIAYTLWLMKKSEEPVIPAGAMHLLEQRMSSRLERVRQVCDEHKIGPETKSDEFLLIHPPSPQYSVFYFDQQRDLAYCPIYKAASTSVLYWLLRLKGMLADDIENSGKQISDLARLYYPSIDYPEAAELMDTSLSFTIVRHPFERLLSAYRDKLEDSKTGREHGTWHYYQKYGKAIVAKFRRRDSKSTQPEPTFPEFVDYLINTDLTLYADDHWIPYYLFCTPCLVNYDLIIKFETIEQDLGLFLEHVRLDRPPEWKHMTRGGRSIDKVQSYFGQLTRKQVNRLYRKFQFDFQLFDYSVDEYLNLAADSD